MFFKRSVICSLIITLKAIFGPFGRDLAKVTEYKIVLFCNKKIGPYWAHNDLNIMAISSLGRSIAKNLLA